LKALKYKLDTEINEIELSYVSITYAEPIVYFDYKEGAELGFPEMKELIAGAEKLSGHKPYFTYADVRVNVNVTNEGKKFLADLNNMPLFRGTAALVKNNVYKFAANFMNHYSKQKYPFRAFTSKEEAIAWLLSLPLD
jgi:hypothetical protein